MFRFRGRLLALLFTSAALSLSALMMGAATDTRIADAAMQGDEETIRTLLKQGVDVNAAQGDGMTALHWAAMHDDAEMAQILLYAGANVKAESRIGSVTPLSLATQSGSPAIVEMLLKAGANPKTKMMDSMTPLMVAATAGNPDVVNLLLKAGADVNAHEGMHGQTALMFAAAYNRAAAIKVLLANGADPKLTTEVHDPPARGFRGTGPGGGGPPAPRGNRGDGQNPPAQRGSAANLQNFQQQPQRGARGQQPPPDDEERQIAPTPMGGLTPLLYAARQGHSEAVRALLDGGADINEASAGDRTSPLMIAVMNGHFDLAMELIRRGANVAITTSAGATPLYAAINVHWAPKAYYPEPSTRQEKTSLLELMDALLHQGANPNARLGKELWYTEYAGKLTSANSSGATPFWRAAQVGDVDALKLLVARGADPNIETTEGVTPLAACAGQGFYGNDDRTVPAGRMPAVKYLVEELHAEVNSVDRNPRGGYTPLHNAAARGDNEMILYLVSKGAKVDAVSKTGQTTADMANGPRQRIQPYPETVALLVKLGSTNSNKCVSC
jgi:ankyrin repeat protein